MTHTIFVVDDEANVLSAVRRCLRTLPVRIEGSTNAFDALAAIESHPGDVAAVISDQRMPGMDGLELLRIVKEARPTTVRVLFTGFAEMDVVVRAINVGEVFRFVRKPWDDLELQGVVQSAIQQHELLVENMRLREKVQQQEAALKDLEDQQPGITKLPPRDAGGAFIIEPPESGSGDALVGSEDLT
ncbi:MAG: response regulator [Planctomycetota bacterium]|jgi:DNA-binding NtrC family response regulator